MTHLYYTFWQYFVLHHCLGDFRFKTAGLVVLLFLQKVQWVIYVPYPQICKNKKIKKYKKNILKNILWYWSTENVISHVLGIPSVLCGICPDIYVFFLMPSRIPYNLFPCFVCHNIVCPCLLRCRYHRSIGAASLFRLKWNETNKNKRKLSRNKQNKSRQKNTTITTKNNSKKKTTTTRKLKNN